MHRRAWQLNERQPRDSWSLTNPYCTASQIGWARCKRIFGAFIYIVHSIFCVHSFRISFVAVLNWHERVIRIKYRQIQRQFTRTSTAGIKRLRLNLWPSTIKERNRFQPEATSRNRLKKSKVNVLSALLLTIIGTVTKSIMSNFSMWDGEK